MTNCVYLLNLKLYQFFTSCHVKKWRRQWPPTPMFFPGESQGWGGLVGCCLWGHTKMDMTEVT